MPMQKVWIAYVFFFQANKELRITKTVTRADEKLDLISLDEYLKKLNASVTPDDLDDGENDGGGNEGGDEEASAPTV